MTNNNNATAINDEEQTSLLNNTKINNNGAAAVFYDTETSDELVAQPSFFQKAGASMSVIFSTLNTMVGSTLLAIPWGFRESGLVLGLIVFFGIGIISYYTCTLVVRTIIDKQEELLEQRKKDPNVQVEVDFPDVCVLVLGRWAKILALIVSIAILVGASMAYHIFMKDCLVSIVEGIWNVHVNQEPMLWYWNNFTAASYVILAVFPFVNLKKLTFLIKVNTFGILFVLLLLIYVIYSCTYALIHPESTITTALTSTSSELPAAITAASAPPLVDYMKLFNKDWSHLLGILSLSFFIHNVIASIIKDPTTKPIPTRKYSANSANRDIAISYILSGLVYLIPGVLGLLAFRFAPTVQGNYLNQFSNKNIVANVARSAVLLQLLSIFPLLIYVIRVQVFTSIFGTAWPNFPLVFSLNVACCAVTTAVASFYPNVGTILRYTGAFSGLIYMYFLPILVHLVLLYKKGQLRWYSVIFHSCLVLMGAATLVLQFVSF